MNSLHLYLFVLLADNLFVCDIPDVFFSLPAMIHSHSSGFIHGEAGIYICSALFLLALAAFLFSVFDRIRSNRMLKREIWLINDVFAKITHEFRTPLTVILGLSKQLREQKNLSNGNLSTYLNAIERQGKNLSKLVNQLLDIASLQTSGKITEWKTGNIVAFAEMVAETFRIYAMQKEVEVVFFSDETEIVTDFVPDFLNKILYNLLSNAVRYSDEGSRVRLVLERKERHKVLFRVIDHGKGIDKKDLPHIFDLFYKCRHEGAGDHAGNGIGLALTKQITDALGGSIRVESELGKGCVFTIELPIRRNEKHLYSHWKPQRNAPPPPPEEPGRDDGGDDAPAGPGRDDPRTTILLAEDNKDIALYIHSMFPQERYNVIYSPNGEKALEAANAKIPDIVITDIIMPRKNGIELCREMKASPLLNHIPVIIISAKNGESDLIEGLKSGADGYIRKPFYPEELQVYVNNLLETRRLLKDKYRRIVHKEENEKKGDNVNDEFMRHVTDIIYREMKNPDFTAGKLARELALSLSQLNKKLNAVTGHPSSTYILQVKLSHAKKIIQTQNKTIGEVATECGIYDVNYFSRIFKKHTGVTPTQFKRMPR